MNCLVLYDSLFGNTKLVADAIAQELAADCVFIGDVTENHLHNLDLLVVGSPINGWRPSARTGVWLASLHTGQLQGLRVATFDTRIGLFIHGDAAKQMAKLLQHAGATMAADPTWFYVKGKEGPLKEGELERARTWAKTLLG